MFEPIDVKTTIPFLAAAAAADKGVSIMKPDVAEAAVFAAEE
jgi:hypothetical protein